MRPRILLVDDHEIVRKGIRQLLEVPCLDLCGEASNGKEAVQKVLSLKPDLVLLDLSMPVMSGAEAMKQIRQVAAEVKIIILTVDDEIADTNGADACVSKGSVVSNLHQTIERVCSVERRPKVVKGNIACVGLPFNWRDSSLGPIDSLLLP
jgi:DNA-binding NarL/FixJ family response regulator